MEFAAGAAEASEHSNRHTMDTMSKVPTQDPNTLAPVYTRDHAEETAERVVTKQHEYNAELGFRDYVSLLAKDLQPWKHRNKTDEQKHTPYARRSVISGSETSSTNMGDPEKKGSGSGSDTEFVEITHANTNDTVNSTTRNIYRDGELVNIPAPSQDPKDPLNLPTHRKFLALFFLCFFGAMAAAAELILGAMLPVFALYYADIDYKYFFHVLNQIHGLPKGADSLETLNNLPHGQPIWKIYLLASLPVLMIGVSNLILIPAAITYGRRPVVLVAGVVAIAGCVWAGASKSLDSHLAARCIQAIGAGTVESLIPFIIQDMVYIHQRNTWISGVFAAQGIIIIAIGISAPYMILNITWRLVYYMTAAAAGFFLIGVVFLLPETRWERTNSEMNGIPRRETQTTFEPRTWKYDLAFQRGPVDYQKGIRALWDTLRTFFYPHIFFITMLNSAMISCALAAGYTVSPALLTNPWAWKFQYLGLCLIPVLIAAALVGLITGKGADMVANWSARRRGIRVPENQLLNLVFPTICALLGSVLFGLAGQDQSKYSWGTFLFALGLMAFGFLGANTVGAVYVLESYPQIAGPALVNIASFRCLIAFILSFRVSVWIAEWGYLKSMIIYTALMGAFALLIPVVYIWGPGWRTWLEEREEKQKQQKRERRQNKA